MNLLSIPPSTTRLGLQIAPDGAVSQISWDAAEGGLGAWQGAVGEDAELLPLPSVGMAMIASTRFSADGDGWGEPFNAIATRLLLDEHREDRWAVATAIVGPVLLIGNRITCDGGPMGLQLGQIAAIRQYVARARQAMARAAA